MVLVGLAKVGSGGSLDRRPVAVEGDAADGEDLIGSRQAERSSLCRIGRPIAEGTALRDRGVLNLAEDPAKGHRGEVLANRVHQECG